MKPTLRQPLSRRRLLALSGASVAGAGLAACGAGSTSSSGSGSKQLRIVVEAGGKGELTPIAEAFKAETGTRVQFVELPYEGLFERVQSELSSGAPSFDLAALDSVWLSTFSSALTPMDELYTSAVREDLFPALVQEATIDGSPLGMPAWTNSEIVFYRTDLFEQGANQRRFSQEYGYDLAAPTDWQQFGDIAEFFTKGKMFGTDVKGAVETEWLAHVLQAGSEGVVLDGDGNVIIDNEGHRSALAFYTDLATRQKVSPPGPAQVDWAAAQNFFQQGTTSMMRFWAHAFPMIPDDSPVKGKVGVAPMIAGSAGIAGIPGPWYLSVPTESPKPDLAMEFVQFAYDNNKLSVDSPLGLAARKSVFEEYADQAGYEHFAAMQTTLDAAATAPRPATPKWQQIVDTVLIPTIQQSLGGNADPDQLLAKAKTDVEAILA